MNKEQRNKEEGKLFVAFLFDFSNKFLPKHQKPVKTPQIPFIFYIVENVSDFGIKDIC